MSQSPFDITGVPVRTYRPSGSPILNPLARGSGEIVLDFGGPPEMTVMGVMIDGKLVFRHLHDCHVMTTPDVGNSHN